MSESESESSDDSINKYLVDPSELNLDSSFFHSSKLKPNETSSETETNAASTLFEKNVTSATRGNESSRSTNKNQRSEKKKKKDVLGEKKSNNGKEREPSDDDGFHDVSESNYVDFTQILENMKSNMSTEDSGRQDSSFAGNQSAEQVPASANEIFELLLKGESGSNTLKRDREGGDSSDDDLNETAGEYQIPKEGVTITLPGSSLLFKPKKKGVQDPLAPLRKRFREIQLAILKVSLLCWLSYGFHLNQLINNPEVMSTALSLLASNNYPKGRTDMSYIEKVTKWFKNLFKAELDPQFTITTVEKLLKSAEQKKFSDYSELVLLFVALMRGVGLNCRLVLSLCPARSKVPENLLNKAVGKSEEIKAEGQVTEKAESNTNTGSSKSSKIKENGKRGKSSKSSKSSKVKAEDEEDGKDKKKTVAVLNSPEAKKHANLEAKKRAAEILKAKSKEKSGSKSSKSTETRKTKVEEKMIKTEIDDKDSEKKISPASRLKQLRPRKKVGSKESKMKEDSLESQKDRDSSESEVESVGRRMPVTRGRAKSEATVSKYYKKVDPDEDKMPAKKTKLSSKEESGTVSKYYRGNSKQEEPEATGESTQTKRPRRRAVNKNVEAASLSIGHSSKKLKKEVKKEVKKEDPPSDGEFQEKITRREKPRNLKSAKTISVVKKENESSDSDSEFVESETNSEEAFEPAVKKRVVRRKLRDKQEEIDKKSTSKGQNSKLLSSDSEENSEESSRRVADIWAEVYLESEESWISVCVPEAKIHCVNEIYRRAKKPVLYVIGWNSEGLIKDLTRRYSPNWLTVTRKQRVNQDWWDECLAPWKEKNTAISRAEDEMLLQKELEQPLPKTIAECKGHPLYVLQRHLLKYEALYPPNCVPLGRIKTGEAIYSRHCVHTLRSRETWVKNARVVKPNQEPYKIVKSLPKYDKLSGTKIKDLPLELFGEWQTTEYVPPEAKDGIVPRNEYGNVDLFKQSMLPKGTVHINLPGLNRVARKLNIDCAPAVVGFNFGGMGAVPAMEGYVVCAEYEDTLREAWETEQVESAKRAREKHEKQVYSNWKTIIKALLIKEKLAARYNFKEEEGGPSKKAKKS